MFVRNGLGEFKNLSTAHDCKSTTAENKRGLQQYCAQASFRSPIVVTLRFPSASRRRRAAMGGLWKSEPAQ